jgi:hypothetical protein
VPSVLTKPLDDEDLSVALRAKRDVSRVLDQYGMPCDIPERPGSGPQIIVHTESIRLWPKVVVSRKKFTPHQKLAEALAFAAFAPERSVPVVFHKRPLDPYTVTLYLEDFAPLLAEADASLAKKAKR